MTEAEIRVMQLQAKGCQGLEAKARKCKSGFYPESQSEHGSADETKQGPMGLLDTSISMPPISWCFLFVCLFFGGGFPAHLAYVHSQARSRIGATATQLSHTYNYTTVTATATAIQDPSSICDLHHSSR